MWINSLPEIVFCYGVSVFVIDDEMLYSNHFHVFSLKLFCGIQLFRKEHLHVAWEEKNTYTISMIAPLLFCYKECFNLEHYTQYISPLPEAFT